MSFTDAQQTYKNIRYLQSWENVFKRAVSGDKLLTKGNSKFGCFVSQQSCDALGRGFYSAMTQCWDRKEYEQALKRIKARMGEFQINKSWMLLFDTYEGSKKWLRARRHWLFWMDPRNMLLVAIIVPTLFLLYPIKSWHRFFGKRG